MLTLLFCCLASLSCDTLEKVYEREEIIDKVITKEPKDVILEINAEYTSQVDYLRGKILYFRLYKDGFVEFDDYPTKSKDDKQIFSGEAKRLKQFNISESTFIELNNLLSKDEFRNLKNKYEKLVSSCDAIPQVEVRDSKKIVKIDWCDSLTNPYNSPEFPQILVKLFKEIYKIKSDALGREAPYL